jgi:hypothetical protein
VRLVNNVFSFARLGVLPFKLPSRKPFSQLIFGNKSVPGRVADIIASTLRDFKKELCYGYGISDDARKDGLKRKVLLGAIGNINSLFLLGSKVAELPFDDSSAAAMNDHWLKTW